MNLSNDEKAIKIAEDYNAGKGTIKEICKEYGISDKTFQRYSKTLGIKRIDDKYIIPTGAAELKGQVNLLEQEQERGGNMETIKEVNLSNNEKQEQEKTNNSNNTENNITGKKKKTFEIDILTDIAIKVTAGMQQKTMNEFVNDALLKAIPHDILQMIKSGGIK